MVTDTLLSIVFGIANTLLSPLGSISFDFEVTKLAPVLQYVKMAMYIIPLADLMPILVFFVSLMYFRIVVSLIKTIWNLLPIL